MKEAFRRLEEEKQEIETKIAELHEIEKKINEDDFILNEDTLKLMCSTPLRPINKNDLVVKLLEKRFPFMTLKEEGSIYNEVIFECEGLKIIIPVSAVRGIKIYMPYIVPRNTIKKYSDTLMRKAKMVEELQNANSFVKRVKAINVKNEFNMNSISYYITHYHNKKRYNNKVAEISADFEKEMKDSAWNYKTELIKRSIRIRRNKAFLKKYAPLFFEFTDIININNDKIIKRDEFCL